jgi:hypothetical protein
MVTIRGWNNQAAPTQKSGQVAYEPGDSLADIIQGVEDFIVPRGWELWDAAAGPNARAYRYPCLPDSEGQIMYQPCVLDYNTAGYMILKSYEAWNPTTHVGTNLARNCHLTITAQRIDLTYGGEINIAVNQGLLLLMTRANSYWGCSGDQGPTWICELTRVHALDTVATGYPKWAWGTTYFLSDPTGGTSNGYASLWPISHPRNRGGTASILFLLTDYGAAGRVGGATYVTAAITHMPGFSSSLSGKPWVSNVRALVGGGLTITESLGTLLGLLVMSRTQGSHMGDEVSVTVTPDAGFAGQKFVDHDGALETWWLVGGIIGGQVRLAVEK